MMHRDEKKFDSWEQVCSIDVMRLHRFRMKRVQRVDGPQSDGSEGLVVSMKGEAAVSMDGGTHELHERDVCYIPKGEKFAISGRDGSELLVGIAPAANRYEPFVRKFKEVEPIVSGKPPFERHIYNMVTEKDKANRFLGGFVEGESGNWTSFPPHRHDGKPEVYVYFGMGDKFGVQMVLTEERDASYVVRDGDAVLFEKGYHPNVAAPGTGMNFFWLISAPPEKRDLSVSFHPAFESMQSGPTHLKTK